MAFPLHDVPACCPDCGCIWEAKSFQPAGDTMLRRRCDPCQTRLDGEIARRRQPSTAVRPEDEDRETDQILREMQRLRGHDRTGERLEDD